MRLLPSEYAVRNLGRSPVRLMLTVGGCVLVVLLVIAAAAFVRGMTQGLRASGSERNVILLGAGSDDGVERSEIGSGIASLVGASIPGLRTTLGVEHVSPEVHAHLPVWARAEEGGGPLVVVRGVTPTAMLVYERVQIVEGRFPEPGRDEVMIGRLAPVQMGLRERGVGPGSAVYIDGRPWSVVGRFVAPGTVMEGEIWAPLADLKTLMKRDTDSCVVLTLDDAEFADVDAFARQRLDLELMAIGEAAYYAKLEAFFGPVRLVVWATAVLIALGGVLGGLNTMYAAFSARARELGMLRCLGFRRRAILLSMVQESVLATLAGALVACVLALVVIDGTSVRFSMGTVGLVVDALVVVLGMAAGLALGLLGSLPPALRALRMEIPVSLKAV